MSATPRPWRMISGARISHGHYIGDAGGEVTGIDGPDGAQIAEVYEDVDRDFILRAVNAFDALLAVAKARYDESLDDAMDALDASFPDWRTWE